MVFIIVSISIFTLLNIFRILLSIVITNRIVNRHIDFAEVFRDSDFGLESKHFFVTAEDGIKISGYLVEADNPSAVIVCLSGMHYPSCTAYLGHAKLFRQEGISTVYFDMRAHGESEGDMICLGYKEHLDVNAIIKFIRQKQGYEKIPVALMGFSLGASSAFVAAGESNEICCVISLSAYSTWEDIFSERMEKKTGRFLAEMQKPLTRAAMAMKYGQAYVKYTPLRGIRKIADKPLLLMQSTDDQEVRFSNFQRLLQNAPSTTETFIREGNNHFIVSGLFSEPEKDQEYCTILLGFIKKNLKSTKYAVKSSNT